MGSRFLGPAIFSPKTRSPSRKPLVENLLVDKLVGTYTNQVDPSWVSEAPVGNRYFKENAGKGPAFPFYLDLR